MKNKLYLISLISLLAIGGCKGKTSSSEVESSKESSSTNSSIVSSSKNETEANILIEYYYSNGELVNKHETKGVVGESYSVNTPSIDFMKPDYNKVDFTLTSEGFYQKVVYDYSLEPIEKVEAKQDFSSFMVDEEKGLSFSYVISGVESTSTAIFDNDYFAIYNHGLRVKNNDKYADFSYEKAVKSNFATDTSLLTSIDNEIYVTISINKDYSIDFYKDGVMNYTFVSTMRPSYSKFATDVYFKEVVENIFTGVASNGFTIGEKVKNMKNLTVSYALDKKEAKALYEKNIHTQIKYVDEFNNEILERKSLFNNKDDAYSFDSPEINNFTYDKNKIEGVADKSKVEYVKYTFNGTEKITNEMKANKSNILNRYDTYNWANQEWFKVGENLDGDFVSRVNFHLEGAASKSVSTNGGDCCWRTNLTIIHDPVTNNRYVARLDWWGWMDDVNNDGKKIGTAMDHGTSYLDNYDYDIFNVYNDCDITETITRDGSKVTIDFIIKPNKVGYENRVYHHSVSLSGVTSSKLNVSFCAEDSIVTFNSVKIID